MFKNLLQWTCDVCGATDSSDGSSTTRTKAKTKLQSAGWMFYGGGDVCCCQKCAHRCTEVNADFSPSQKEAP